MDYQTPYLLDGRFRVCALQPGHLLPVFEGLSPGGSSWFGNAAFLPCRIQSHGSDMDKPVSGQYCFRMHVLECRAEAEIKSGKICSLASLPGLHSLPALINQAAFPVSTQRTCMPVCYWRLQSLFAGTMKCCLVTALLVLHPQVSWEMHHSLKQTETPANS